MTDLDLLVAGAMVTFLAVAGAYIAIRHRANETPVDSYKSVRGDKTAKAYGAVEAFAPADNNGSASAGAQSQMEMRN